MRKYFFLAIIGATCLSASIDDDGSNYTESKPALELDITIAFGDCEVGATGYKNLTGTTGDEIDPRLSCSKEVAGFTLKASVEHYIYEGPNQTRVSVQVSRETTVGTFDIGVGRYMSEGPDATAVQIGFSPKLSSESFDLRVYGTHERGYGIDPITTVGVQADWHLDDHWSLTGNLVIAVDQAEDDFRGTVGMIGLRRTF